MQFVLRCNAFAFERVTRSQSMSRFSVSMSDRRFLFRDRVVGVDEVDADCDDVMLLDALGLDLTSTAPLSSCFDDEVPLADTSERLN